MTIKVSKNKNTDIVLTIALISLVTIAFLLTSCFPQSNIRKNTETIINQVPKQSSLPVSITGINEINSLNVTNSYYDYSSAPLNTDPILLGTLNSTTYKQPDLATFFFSLPYNTNQGQIAGSDVTPPISVTDINETDRLNADNIYNNNSYAPLTTVPISLDASKFIINTYGGYSVQQPDSTQFIFSVPDNTNQGQIAGSDALTWNSFAIQKIDFDAAFIAPKIGALGFDEMVIFATSNTNTYKGTEFGIRMDLKDGFIYGYVQEPNGNYGDVNFKMLELTPNDGIMHHYTLIMLGSEVSFCIDGIDYGYLKFPSNTDYSSLTFAICAVVHRFTDDWDSNGDNMIAGSLSLNQQ